MDVIRIHDIGGGVKLGILLGGFVDSLDVHEPLLRNVLLGGLHLVPETRPPDGVGPGARAAASPHPRLGQPQPLLGELHQPLLDLGILRDVEGRLAGPRDGADVRPVLRQNLHGLEVAPAGRGVQRLPEVDVADLGGAVVVQQELQHGQVAVSGGDVERRGALPVPVLQVAVHRRQLHQVGQHLVLGLGPGRVDKLLGDAPLGHLVLDVRQGGLVLADVVRHVAVTVHREQVCPVVDEKLDEVEVAAGGGRVERSPLLRVRRVHVRAELHEHLHHLLAVVDAALVQRRQPVLVGAVRRHAEAQQPPHLVDIVPGGGLEQHHRGLEVDPGRVLGFQVVTRLLPFQVVFPLSLGPSFELQATPLPGNKPLYSLM